MLAVALLTIRTAAAILVAAVCWVPSLFKRLVTFFSNLYERLYVLRKFEKIPCSWQCVCVCSSHFVPMFPPTSYLHPAQSVSAPIPPTRRETIIALRSQTTRQRYAFRIQQGIVGHAMPTAINEHAGKRSCKPSTPDHSQQKGKQKCFPAI